VPGTWFRRAEPAGFGWNLAKTGAQVAVFWGVLLAIVPPLIARAERTLPSGWPRLPAMPTAGWILLAMASAGGIWSAVTMVRDGHGTPLPLDSPRWLVVTGPYAWVRNPMAVFGLAQGLGVALVLGSTAVAGYVAAGGVLWNVFVRPREEADLSRTFGAAYDRHRRAVRCWIPRRQPWRAPSTSR
jgi:protein-S-isoprenylcysteine O-methyltransferase Ste14